MPYARSSGLATMMGDTYRVLVTSSRSWTLRTKLYAALDDAERRAHEAGYRAVVIVHGHARGGDKMADDWTLFPSPLAHMARLAERHALTRADWYPGGKFDPSAGMRRNAEMVALGADEALAFADECRKTTCARRRPHISHGTAHCIGLAERAGMPTRKVPADG
jgi:hypothetical protein